MSRYAIKDVFCTLQGEGLRVGTKAVFVRFAGCNLWDGSPLHRDRGIGACARWCDTDFFKGKVLDTDELLARMGDLWPPGTDERWCVLTGGEPCLQIDKDLMLALRDHGWKVAIETNGTEENENALDADHICIAPKLDEKGQPLPLALERAHEIKVVLPGIMPGKQGWTVAQLLAVEEVARDVFKGAALFVQPQDPLVDPTFVEETALKRTRDVEPNVDVFLENQYQASLQQCIAWVLSHPTWRLSMQQHKHAGMP